MQSSAPGNNSEVPKGTSSGDHNADFGDEILNPLLEGIRAAAHTGLTEVEQQRLLRDLTRTLFRLDQRQYARASFDDNLLDLRGRLMQLSHEIDFYRSCARLWTQVLRPFVLPPVVADLCPGYAPKVELALRSLKYAGEVHIIDKDPNSALEIERFIELFDSPFSVKGRAVDALSSDFGHYELVTASHIVDDLVMDILSPDASRLYDKEETFSAFWSDVLKNPEPTTRLALEKIEALFERAVAPTGCLVVVQYPSYAERTLGLEAIHHFCMQILEQLAVRLEKRFVVTRPPLTTDEAFSQWRFFVFTRRRA